MEKIDIRVKLNQLIAFAQARLSLDPNDKAYTLNLLLDLFKLNSPAPTCNEYPNDLQEIVQPIVDYAIQNGITTQENALLFETKVLGMVTPMPSQIIQKFYAIHKASGVQAATDWLFQLCKDNNYLRMIDINKNIKWQHKGKMGDIDITINLSKPEKDPKQILLAKSMPQTGYPACMLCATNVGFAGHINHPARQTLRIIPIEMGGEPWAIQYSPYQYYDQHVIALSMEHRPMEVTPSALKRLGDFVDIFPHYFLGSNASLPIVGGSILTHDHYQGGNKVLPMFKVGTRKTFLSDKFPDVKICIADWYNSVVRISSNNKNQVLDAATMILESWKVWSDESVGVICKTDEQHNAITPICRKENDTYYFDMILRNNRTDNQHPFGIFHAAQHLHNIKKEGIGIIEVMGLFILPGRLKTELESIQNYLSGATKYDAKLLSDEQHPLNKHAQMINLLIDKNGNNNSKEKAAEIVQDYINSACEEILECTAVFKNDQNGRNAFDKFMKEGAKLKEV